MSWSLLRGSIQRRFRSQIPMLTLNGRHSYLRSVSSDSCIVPSDPFANIELIPDDTRYLEEPVFVPSDTIKCGRYPILTMKDKFAAARSSEKFLENVVRCLNKTGIVYQALHVICHYSVFETCSIDTKLKILSTAFDQIRTYSQADTREVFLMNVFIRSMSNDNSKNDITKDEVISRVLDVTQSYPKVGHNKVTEETHFRDLGFDDFDCDQVHKALYLEFKLYIPKLAVNDTCKQSVDYIYDNHMKRFDFEEFRENNLVGHVFWPKPV